jgi:hypothetical protein
MAAAARQAYLRGQKPSFPRRLAMRVLPRLRTAASVIDGKIERIRLYQSFVLYADSHRLPSSARRRLGLEE